MYRLLLLVLVLSLGGGTGSVRAASEGSNIEIVSVDLAGRQTNLTHDPAWDVNPAVARDGRIAFVAGTNVSRRPEFSGASHIWIADADGSHAHALTHVDPVVGKASAQNPVNARVLAFVTAHTASGTTTARRLSCPSYCGTAIGMVKTSES